VLCFEGMSPLHIAVDNKNIEMVDTFCEYGANVTMQEGTYGRTPLHLCVEKESEANILMTLLLLGTVSTFF